MAAVERPLASMRDEAEALEACEVEEGGSGLPAVAVGGTTEQQGKQKVVVPHAMVFD